MIKKIGVLLALAVFLLGVTPSYAHSGRTDSRDGHKDNRNVSGLGSYHFHHGYSAHLHPNGVCPYSAGTDRSPQQSTPPPAAPVPDAPKASEAPKHKKERYTVSVERTHIYETASKSAKILTSPKEGYTFTPAGSTKSFWKVEFKKKNDDTVYTGYILKDDVKLKP